jgi:hypothetical protein
MMLLSYFKLPRAAITIQTKVVPFTVGKLDNDFKLPRASTTIQTLSLSMLQLEKMGISSSHELPPPFRLLPL